MPRKKPKLSQEAQSRIDLAGQMMSTVLESGGIPEIVIAAKTINTATHELKYYVVSPLEQDQIRYVLTRVLGLMDGSIQENN